MDLITIFTPTYDRGYILGELYQSLTRQTDKRFEWLIVDDGSKDDTEIRVREWIDREDSFLIRYHKTANGGKHRAINQGVRLARGKLFFIVDSDDQLTSDAVEKLFAWEQEIAGEDGFAGVSGNRGKLGGGDLIGETFEGEHVDATALERGEYHIFGDKAEAYYTDILKRYPFPEIAGEKFLTESVVWDRIAHDGYKIRWKNQIIYLCEYIEDGLTLQGRSIFAKNPKGYALSVRQTCAFTNASPKGRVLAAYYYYQDVKGTMTLQQALELLEMPPVTALGVWMQTAKTKLSSTWKKMTLKK